MVSDVLLQAVIWTLIGFVVYTHAIDAIELHEDGAKCAAGGGHFEQVRDARGHGEICLKDSAK